jgi:hypothetical protein
LGEVASGVLHLQGQAIVALGLVLLVATPVLRVAVSILAFAYQRDRAFILITSLVFLLLMLSFLLGKGDERAPAPRTQAGAVLKQSHDSPRCSRKQRYAASGAPLRSDGSDSQPC